MSRVMIKCPVTKKPTFTGMELSQQVFDSSTIGGNSFRCSQCGQMHTWSKPEAYLE